MYIFQRLIAWMGILNKANLPIEQIQQSKLIKILSFELIMLGSILIYITGALHLWALLFAVILYCIFLILNLSLLNNGITVLFSGYILTTMSLLLVTYVNYLAGGLSTPFFDWYYLVLVLAATTTYARGLFIFSGIILSLAVLFYCIEPLNLYNFSKENFLIVNLFNRFFSILFITIAAYSTLRKNLDYEKLLLGNYYLLQADKHKFQYLARYDSLTNLPNRSYFQTYAQSIIENVHQDPRRVTIFFMDLDKFKHVNDFFGHDAGDSFLLETAKRLKLCFRENDFIARLGGDEFIAIVLHRDNDNIAFAIAGRILEEFNKPFTIEQQKVYCQISIGLASSLQGKLTADELIATADKAMYLAKKEGGNTYYLMQTEGNSQ